MCVRTELTLEEVFVDLATVLLGDQHGVVLGGVLRVGSRPTRLPVSCKTQDGVGEC